MLVGMEYGTPDRSVAPTQEQLLEAHVEFFGHASAIPVRNRLRYLIGDDRPSYGHTEVDELVGKLGIDIDELQTIVNEMNVPYEMIAFDEESNASFAPGLDAVITEEIMWRKAYVEIDEFVSIRHAADIFNIKFNTTEKLLSSYGVDPQRAHNGDNQIRLYPKQLLYRLRADIMMFPPPRNNKTIPQIIGAVGCGREWAEARIGDKFVPDLMRSPSGQIRDYYPAAFEDHVRSNYDVFTKDTVTLRTRRQIADELNRDEQWVKARLIRYYRNHQAGLKRGAERTLYDDNAFQSLRHESEYQRNLPVISSSEVTLEELTQAISTTYETAERVLKKIGIQPYERQSASNGKIVKAYDISVKETLARAIIEDREQHIAEQAAIAARLSSVPRESLSREERLRLRTAKQQLVSTPKHLQRARDAYAALTSS